MTKGRWPVSKRDFCAHKLCNRCARAVVRSASRTLENDGARASAILHFFPSCAANVTPVDGGRCDMYAIAVVLWELVTLGVPFADKPPQSIPGIVGWGAERPCMKFFSPVATPQVVLPSAVRAALCRPLFRCVPWSLCLLCSCFHLPLAACWCHATTMCCAMCCRRT